MKYVCRKSIDTYELIWNDTCPNKTLYTLSNQIDIETKVIFEKHAQ